MSIKTYAHRFEITYQRANLTDSYRHEALVLIQPLLIGSNKEASILDPARVKTSLFLQVFAYHIPSVC